MAAGGATLADGVVMAGGALGIQVTYGAVVVANLPVLAPVTFNRQKPELFPVPVTTMGTGRESEPSNVVYVVRAGVVTPTQLKNGTAIHTGVPGLEGFSVQSAPGMRVDQLAASGNFPNKQISVTTVEQLKSIGVVVQTSPGQGMHATVVVPVNAPDTVFVLISGQFVPRPNPAPRQ